MFVLRNTLLPRRLLQVCRPLELARHGSQLYPSTGERYDGAMVHAESIVGNASDFSNLQKWVSGEFNTITKYLEKLVGSNHPMLETAKRCTYIGEGRMGSAQARGLTVILTAKAGNQVAGADQQAKSERDQIVKNQISLAEMTEITYSAYMMHRGVMDLNHSSALGRNSVHFDPQRLHYGNKVSVLCGDFLLAYVMRGLGDLFSARVVGLVAAAISQFMEGEFLLLDDWRSPKYLDSKESRDFDRWQRRSYSSIGCLQANTCQAAMILANANNKLEMDAREFGMNLGLAWQAHTELQPFLSDKYEAIELPELPPFPSFDLNSLPVLVYLRNLHKTNRFDKVIRELRTSKSQGHLFGQHLHDEYVDYEKLHKLIMEEREAIDETYRIVNSYSQSAIRRLESFPPSDETQVLKNICESLCQSNNNSY